MLQRNQYLEQIRPHYDSDSVKVVTGMRQSGKSVLMAQIREELEKQGKKTVALDFADPAVANACRDAQSLFACIGNKWKRRRKKTRCYVFLDGVQNLAHWGAVCRMLTLSSVSLFVAGNGAPLLTEAAKEELGGEYVEFRVRPFAYKELRAWAAELGKDAPVEEYLLYGGFPGRLKCADQAETLRYLGGVNEAAMRDLLGGGKVQRETLFRRVADFILTQNGRKITANAVHTRLKEEGFSCSINTVMNYLGGLEAACLIHRLPCYSARACREKEFHTKIYDEDVAFHTVRQPQDVDLGCNMENVVYNELIAMGYTLSGYEDQGYSIDFLARKDGRAYWVQVAESVAKKKVREQKFRLLNKLDNARKKVIITNDGNDYSTGAVEHIRLKDFLMMEDLQG